MQKLSELIVKLRWFIIAGFILLTAIFALQIPKARVNPDIKEQLPGHMTSRVITDQIDELFGGTEMIMIMLKTNYVLNPKTLERTRQITRKLKRVKGVDKVISLFELKNIKGEEGAMIVDPAVKRIPKTAAEREELRREIRENDVVYGSVVSEDFTATAIIGFLDVDVSDLYIVQEAQRIIAELPGDEEAVIGGLPFVRLNIAKDIQGDMQRLMPFGLLIMLAFLFISFRQIRGVLLPFFVVLMSIIFAIGLIPTLGWEIQIVTVLLPVMLIAIANDYGIHLIARYQENNAAGMEQTNKDLARRIFQSLSKPVILTGITTMVGMLCLLNHIIIPAQQLGILAALSIAFALIASLFFIPAVLAVIPKAKPIAAADHNNNKKVPPLERMLRLFGNLVSSQPKAIIISSLVITLIASAGIFLVVIDTNPTNYYDAHHPVVQAMDMTNDYFGGSTNVSVVLRGDIKDPGIMHKIDGIEEKLEALPEVGNTVSIARVIKQMSRALNDPDEPGYDKIPDSRNAVAQYFELYSMSGDPEDFDKLVDFPYENAQITARINEVSTRKIDQVVDFISDMVRDVPEVKMVGGFATILTELAQAIVRGQIVSLGMALILVGVLIMIVFRSLTAGLISALPLTLSIAILFGLMGYFGIELNIATAMLSSIMIGVGVDYTIHFLWRYKEELRTGLSHKDAVKKTLTTTGRGIVFNALSVIIGFVILLVSNFLPVRFFGFLIVVSISACLTGALILIPSLCLVLKPKFLEP